MSLLPKDTKESVWIGLNERAQEGEWVNADGSSTKYTNWDKDQPNNYNGIDEDCGFINFMGKSVWHDSPCNWQIWFMCERKVGPMPRMSDSSDSEKWDMSMSEGDSSDDDMSWGKRKRGGRKGSKK